MYAREVSMHLKANAGAEFTRTIEKDILPRLRKQTGFADELTFLNPNGKDAVAISLWDRKENADAYSRDSYPDVLKSLAAVVEGTPQVQAYEVANSTYHKIAAQNVANSTFSRSPHRTKARSPLATKPDRSVRKRGRRRGGRLRSPAYFRWRPHVMTTATKTKLKVFPLADRVAIRPLEETEEMKGGLYIPDTAKEKPIQGEVIAVGPGRMEKGQRVPMELKVGDRVVYGKYTGSQVELDEEEIILIKESDVIAKLS